MCADRRSPAYCSVFPQILYLFPAYKPAYIATRFMHNLYSGIIVYMRLFPYHRYYSTCGTAAILPYKDIEQLCIMDNIITTCLYWRYLHNKSTDSHHICDDSLCLFDCLPPHPWPATQVKWSGLILPVYSSSVCSDMSCCCKSLGINSYEANLVVNDALPPVKLDKAIE